MEELEALHLCTSVPSLSTSGGCYQMRLSRGQLLPRLLLSTATVSVPIQPLSILWGAHSCDHHRVMITIDPVCRRLTLLESPNRVFLLYKIGLVRMGCSRRWLVDRRSTGRTPNISPHAPSRTVALANLSEPPYSAGTYETPLSHGSHVR